MVLPVCGKQEQRRLQHVALGRAEPATLIPWPLCMTAPLWDTVGDWLYGTVLPRVLGVDVLGREHPTWSLADMRQERASDRAAAAWTINQPVCTYCGCKRARCIMLDCAILTECGCMFACAYLT